MINRTMESFEYMRIVCTNTTSEILDTFPKRIHHATKCCYHNIEKQELNRAKTLQRLREKLRAKGKDMPVVNLDEVRRKAMSHR
jgi:hypothetical protein